MIASVIQRFIQAGLNAAENLIFGEALQNAARRKLFFTLWLEHTLLPFKILLQIRQRMVDRLDLGSLVFFHVIPALLLSPLLFAVPLVSLIVSSSIILLAVSYYNTICQMGLWFPFEQQLVTLFTKLFIKFQVYPKYPNNETLLHLTAKNGYSRATELLIENGADLDAKNAQGETPLLLSIQSTRNRIPLFNSWFESKETLYSRSMNVIKLLVSKGAKLDITDNTHFGLLHSAVKQGAVDITQYLIDNNQDVNQPINYVDGAFNRNHVTPLHTASEAGYSKITEALIRAGADVNQKYNEACQVNNTSHEITAVENAVKNGHFETALLLQKHKAELPESLLNTTNKVSVSGKESVQDLSVNISVSESANRLRRHYFFKKITNAFLHWLSPSRYVLQYDLDLAYQSLFAFMNKRLETIDPTPLTDQKSAAKRWFTNPQHLDYKERATGITTRELLGYLWIALNDENETLWYRGDKEQDIKKSRVEFEDDLFDRLYRGFYIIQRAHNLDDSHNDNALEDITSCPGGTFNHVMQIINTCHSQVELRSINSQVIDARAITLIDECFQALPEEEKKSIAGNWTNQTGMPKTFIAQVKDKLLNGLMKDFFPYKDEIVNLYGHISANIMSLKFKNPTPAVQKFQQEVLGYREEPVVAPEPALDLTPSLLFAKSLITELDNTTVEARPEVTSDFANEILHVMRK